MLLSPSAPPHLTAFIFRYFADSDYEFDNYYIIL